MRASWVLLAVSACATSQHVSQVEKDGDRLRVELARAYVEKGAYAAAVPLLQRTVAEQPNDPNIRLLYGTVLRERGLYPQAEKEFLAGLAKAPQNGAIHAGLGMLYDLMRRPEDAERAHRKSIEIEPRNATYWNNLGFSLLVSGQDARAIEVLEKALALDPSLVVAFNNLGFAYGRQKNYAQALRCFRLAVGDPAADLNLALAYERNGDALTAEALRAKALHKMPELARRRP